ncbi:unnamed protein product [Spirodela intermedia]|uniref:Uncharacterized protein n=2 Tax=Spirodela intermedia TaxID=51605 RepID=A0A7I8JJQ6_SPIIN|nr:unnamed protein product [Spirodela intermedia]CAA6670369.1 unnamed protein product [Spirodela intermedia]CAA7407430.1 unnamed protein product [Spirodela intermedia]
MSSAMKKVEMVRQIVKLKQVMGRWRSLSLRPHHRASLACEDDAGSSSGRPIPPGFLAIYIGEERRRFIIPTRFLNFPVITSLLKKSEEEFGYNFSGGLVLPCSVDFFRLVLQLLEKNEAKYKLFSIEDFVELSGTGGIEDPDPFSCRDDVAADDRYNGFSPLLQNARV